MIRKIFLFFQETLWTLPLEKEQGWRYFWIKWLKVFSLAIKNFLRDQCTLWASSLTYCTLFSIVPLLTLLFGLARLVQLDPTIKQILLTRFTEQKDALLKVFEFTDNMSREFHGGIVAVIGLMILFGSAWGLLSTLEQAMNRIWDVPGRCSWKRVIHDCVAFLVVVPCFFLMANGMEFVIEALLGIRLFFLPYALFGLLFTFIYWVIPNRKVSFRSALTGGVVGVTLYWLLKWSYLYSQTQATRLGTIYGSLAALPLFLAWVQASWCVFLFGAEMGHAHQMIINNNQRTDYVPPTI